MGAYWMKIQRSTNDLKIDLLLTLFKTTEPLSKYMLGFHAETNYNTAISYLKQLIENK